MKWFKRILVFSIVVFLYFLPSFIFKTDLEFYNSLEGPKLSSIVFPIVWTILFVLFGIFITYYIENKDKYLKKDFNRTFIFLIINYIFLFLFPYVFFVEHNLFISYVVTLFALLTLVLTLIESLLLNKKMSLLLIPHFIWLIIASIFSILLYLNN